MTFKDTWRFLIWIMRYIIGTVASWLKAEAMEEFWRDSVTFILITHTCIIPTT